MNFLCCRLMQRATAVLVSVALVVSGIAGCATKPRYYARIDGIVVDGQRLAEPREGGLVSVTRDGSTVEGHAGMELRRGDHIVTGPRAEAAIRYASGSELLMRPNSSGRIGSFFDTLGEVFARIRGKFEVETTFVRAAAQGTSFLVRAASGGEATVIVFEGTVRVDSTRSAWAPVTLGAGQMAVAHPRAPQPVPASEAELQATRNWVERIERLVPQPATSSSSTGAAVAAAGVAVAVAAILASRSRSRDSTPPQPPAPDPASTGRATPADRTPTTTGTAGTDRAKAQETTPVRPLGMPTNLQPGGPQNSPPQRICTRGVALSWNPVEGARGYTVRVEKYDNRNKRWIAAATMNTDSAQTTIAQPPLAELNRWQVQARDGNRTGPLSPWVYFGCVDPSAPR